MAVRTLTSALDRLGRILGMAGSLAVALTMLAIVVEVFLRAIDVQLPSYEAVVNYLMPMIAFLPLMRVEHSGQMISVEILNSLAGAPVQSVALRFADFVSTITYAALAFTTFKDALHKLAVHSYVVTMDITLWTWPAYFVLPVAFAAAALVTLHRLFRPVAPGDDLVLYGE